MQKKPESPVATVKNRPVHEVRGAFGAVVVKNQSDGAIVRLEWDEAGNCLVRTDGKVITAPLSPAPQKALVAEATVKHDFGIGALIPGKGVYIGRWTPGDQDGQSLGRVFNLFAAPYDLGFDEKGRGKRLVRTYNRAVEAVGKIENLMGHAGFKGKNEKDFYKALREGTYNGEWLIPPKDVLEKHLYQNKEAGALRGSFAEKNGIFGNAHWYWSCSEPRDDPSVVWAVDFTDGLVDWGLKDFNSLSSRLVRAEPVAP